MDIAFWPATRLVRALRSKKLGALELLDYYAARIRKHDGKLNALPVLDMDAARKRAKALDRKGARTGVPAGLPMTVKESFELEGYPTTWGLPEYAKDKAASNITVIGPMGRSAMDLVLGLSLIAGPDAIDGAGLKVQLPRCEKKALKGWRVAVIATHPTAETDFTVQNSIRRLAQFVASKGAKVSERATPDFDFGEAHRVFIQLLRGATSGRQTPGQFALMQAAKAKLDPKDMGYRAQMVRANTQAHKDWLLASNRRHQMRLAWAEFFKDWDVVLCPNAATAAYPHSMPGERWERMITVNGKPQPVTTQMWWAGISGMCYLPGTAAPIGLSPEGLPLSVQIVGPQYGDFTTIRFAQLLEREYYAFVPPPACA